MALSDIRICIHQPSGDGFSSDVGGIAALVSE